MLAWPSSMQVLLSYPKRRLYYTPTSQVFKSVSVSVIENELTPPKIKSVGCHNPWAFFVVLGPKYRKFPVLSCNLA